MRAFEGVEQTVYVVAMGWSVVGRRRDVHEYSISNNAERMEACSATKGLGSRNERVPIACN